MNGEFSQRNPPYSIRKQEDEEMYHGGDSVECIFRSLSTLEETNEDDFQNQLDFNNESNELILSQTECDRPRRSYDIVLFSSSETKVVNDENVCGSPTLSTFLSRRVRGKFSELTAKSGPKEGLVRKNEDDCSRSLHQMKSIIIDLDPSTRHHRNADITTSTEDPEIDPNDELGRYYCTNKRAGLKKKIRRTCSQQLDSVTCASRRLLSCPLAKLGAQTNTGDSTKVDTRRTSQKLWRISRERAFALQYRYKELEKTISGTCAKTKEILRKKQAETKFNGFQIRPSTHENESRQAGAQRLRELIMQMHDRNMSGRYYNHQNEGSETSRVSEEQLAFEPNDVELPGEEKTIKWKQVLKHLSTTELNGQQEEPPPFETKISVFEGGIPSSHEKSGSSSSIEKLGILLDQYLEKQTTADSNDEGNHKSKNTSRTSMEKLGAFFDPHFEHEPANLIPPPECKSFFEDRCFPMQAKKEKADSLSYSSGLTECSSEDSSIDCSDIVEHENHTTEHFGAYQLEFDLFGNYETEDTYGYN